MLRVLQLTGVSDETASSRTLFEGLSLRPRREHVALVGRNGAGKSTLLAVLAGAIAATSGEVRRRGPVHDSRRATPSLVCFLLGDFG
jgi:ATPase subunit of ABC transporter with duplicated ATPase domains